MQRINKDTIFNTMFAHSKEVYVYVRGDLKDSGVEVPRKFLKNKQVIIGFHEASIPKVTPEGIRGNVCLSDGTMVNVYLPWRAVYAIAWSGGIRIDEEVAPAGFVAGLAVNYRSTEKERLATEKYNLDLVKKFGRVLLRS